MCTISNPRRPTGLLSCPPGVFPVLALALPPSPWVSGRGVLLVQVLGVPLSPLDVSVGEWRPTYDDIEH